MRISGIVAQILSYLIVLTGSASVDALDFAIPDDPPPAIAFSGNLDAKWGMHRTRDGSPFLRANLTPELQTQSYLSQYRLDLYMNGEYRRKQVGFVVRTFSQYVREQPADLSFLELYGSLSLSPRLRMSVGRQRHEWGKGYAFNPVGYVNGQKDPENPDLALAGRASATVTYNRSLSSDALRNLSLTAVVLPPEPGPSVKLAPAEDTGIALKAYALVHDVDIEVMAFLRRDRPTRLGLDFAANLRENVEIHGEASYARDVRRLIVERDALGATEADGISYLAGIRYLHRSGTTLIVEHYHANAGLRRSEFRDYLAYVASAASEPTVADDGLTPSRSRFAMRDYLYLKLSHPEPFGWLYASISAATIVNLADGSVSLLPQLSYEPFTDSQIILWPAISLGGEESESGSRQFLARLEMWARFYF
jgi:hypothetical protein